MFEGKVNYPEKGKVDYPQKQNMKMNKPPVDIDASQMTETQLHAKLQRLYDDYKAGRFLPVTYPRIKAFFHSIFFWKL